MVERRGGKVTITFLAPGEIPESGELILESRAAHHAAVRRVRPGESARLLNGRGIVAHGEVAQVGRDSVRVAVRSRAFVPPLSPLEMIVPVADRDRMLLAAEKCAELQVTAWRPAVFARSRSVSPRGEGPRFMEKVRARMVAALEQSGGAWLPEVHEEVDGADALRAAPRDWSRLLLDPRGAPLAAHASDGAVIVATGPEGGFEDHEVALARELGWRSVSVGATTLRFETAIISAAAVTRSHQMKDGADG